MNFLPETKEILALVEQRTGKRVEFLAEPRLPVLAKVTIASEALPNHIITFNPNKQGIDYNIAYECGFILRLFANAPEERYQFASTALGRNAVRRKLESSKAIKRMKLPPNAIKQFADQIFDGLMTQLRSMPIGMRIDQWLWEQYSGLREAQRASLAKQQQENVQALNPQIVEITPPLVFAANATMNAAYALFCDHLLDRSLYAIAYRAAGFDVLGSDLLNLWQSVASDPQHDRELVDAWATKLNISDWYQWLPMAPMEAS